ncbi:IclR family transcriptional regulator [Haloglomus litoreum]|uniref:IclR family transcriptional regulator n=1 Tax=Haloglomus litoreum TaxID=3034026 RepID=UPI0023E7A18D|nr:IclR family transcriptional regulator [Haloglomus sp. DT116]
MLSTSSSRHVKSVRTGFRIVEVLQNQDGAEITELAEHLDLAKSTVHNYLSTLESMGYVRNQNGTYRIGLRFLTHGMAARSTLGIREEVRAALSDVAEEISQAAWWIAEEQGRGIFVERAVPEGTQAVYGRIGKRSYLHTHGPGKAILAHLPEEYVRRIIDHHGLPVYTNRTITDSERLLEQLAEIRDRGYAFTDGETALGVQSIGVAFEDEQGCSHALGVFGYSHDFGGESLDEDIPMLLADRVEELSRTLTAARSER